MASKLLIVTGEAASADQLPFGVALLIERAGEITVVTPVLPSRLDWLTNATDRVHSEADERLREVIGQITGDATEVRGAVGADDPLVAVDDAVREFGPDHLLIGLRPQDRAGWQERGLLGQIQGRYGIPITVFEVPTE